MNIAQNVERGRRFFPKKTALIFEGKSFSYEQLDRLVNSAANGLRNLGIEKGDRVAIYLPNIPEFIFAYLGILKIGAVAVSINVMLKRDEVWYILNDSSAKAIITTEKLRVNVPDQDLSCLKDIVLTGETSLPALTLEIIMRMSSEEAVAMDMDRKDPATILYTSGTTGFPKGAVLSHGNVISNMYSKIYCCGMRPDDKLLLYLPLFHAFGQNAIMNSGFHACATIILQQRFQEEQVLKAMVEDKATMFFGVPSVFAKLLESNVDQRDLSSVRYFFSAASVLPLELVERWQAHYNTRLYEGYGMTETSPFACYNHFWKHKPGSIGMPIDNVEMKVVDAEDREVEQGQLGEIIVSGPNVMLGYWNRPEETAKVIKNGWFYTGDIGWVDEDGYFYIVDRLKDMINVSGFKVYPSEVERVFYQHPAVAEVAVYGIPNRMKGEIVKANVRLKAGEFVSKKNLMAFCKERMATYKVPQEIEFVDSFPKNASGKVLKRELREEAIREREIAERVTFAK
ncbi:MAG TPA: long-chain fatty acid--CoA ligase [Kamptonema sp.]|nr:long-chain fatty acid--CoA ligase [Kamptonema sp.]